MWDLDTARALNECKPARPPARSERAGRETQASKRVREYARTLASERRYAFAASYREARGASYSEAWIASD